MKPSLLGRLILWGFVAIFVYSVAYVLLDAFGIWPRLPPRLIRGSEVLAGSILLFALLGHLVLATGALPAESPDPQRDR
jgi:hypothetical protein